MAIAPKPNRKPEGITDEKKALEFISGGGKTTQPQEDPEDEKIVGVILRMYSDLKKEIDDLLKSTPKRNRLSRNAWIIQAIEEKLKRGSKISK